MSTLEHEALGSYRFDALDDEVPAWRGLLAGAAATDRRAYLPAFATGVAGIVAGTVTLFANDASVAGVPVALAGAATAALATVDRYRRRARVDRTGIVLAASWVAAVLLFLALPPYLFGANVNGVIHESVIVAPVLLVLGALMLSWTIRRLLDNTPTAHDLAVYPLLALPVGLALLAYALLLGKVVVAGFEGLSLDIITTAWDQVQVGEELVYTVGLRNHILGTLLLMALTCALSILPGIGAAVFISEYPGRAARVVRFCTTMLRAMSVFIIGVALAATVGLAGGLEPDSPVSQLVRGTFVTDGDGIPQAGKGSFLAAAAFLSLLVIPIIARFTEEGLRSVPIDLREGSTALGAAPGYGLRRVLLPWAGPNIVTGLLLGAAEAAGSLAIIIFVAGDGDYGVTPLGPVTGLDYALFSTRYGSQQFISTMGYRAPLDYAYTSALLLLAITLGLTVVALVIRRRFARRYRGSLTLG